jgi:hypothetical protein
VGDAPDDFDKRLKAVQTVFRKVLTEAGVTPQ